MNGTCSDASGTASCTCDAGHAGVVCDSCDTGYQDNDGNGVCAPDCSSYAFGTCDDSSGTAECTCDADFSGPDCTIPATCLVALDNGLSTGTGAYTIDPDGAGALQPMSAYCDMNHAGGGWTLVITSDQTGTNGATEGSPDPQTLAYLPVDFMRARIVLVSRS